MNVCLLFILSRPDTSKSDSVSEPDKENSLLSFFFLGRSSSVAGGVSGNLPVVGT